MKFLEMEERANGVNVSTFVVNSITIIYQLHFRTEKIGLIGVTSHSVKLCLSVSQTLTISQTLTLFEVGKHP